MQIRGGTSSYKFPPKDAPAVGMLLTAHIDEGARKAIGIRYALLLISADDMIDKLSKETPHGRPQAIAFFEGRAHLWPTPLKSAQLLVRYHPPAVQI